MISNPKFYKKITKATAKLVDSLTNFEERSENHEACVEYSLSQFQNHRFLDVDSYKVSRRIKGLCEKFTIHNQPEKAKILKKLESSFLSSDLTEDSPAGSQIHYALLSILLDLSANPVNREYAEPSPEKQEVEEQFDWAKYLLEGEEMLHPTQWAWDDTPYGSEDDEDFTPETEGPAIKDVRAKKTTGHNTLFDTTELPSQNGLVLPYWKKRNETSPDLFFSGISESFHVPTASSMSEANIIREILWLLGGQTDLYIFPCSEEKHTVCSDILLSHMTSASMKTMLQKLAAYGDIVQNLRTFLFCNSSKESQTYQAFSESLLKYLQMFQGELLLLERGILDAEKTILVGDVLKILSPRLNELSVLQNVLQRSVDLDRPQDSCARKVSRLLGQLYNAILDYTHTQCTFSHLESDLLQIWVDSIHPYVDIVDNWISHGSLNDPYDEFILQRSTSVPDSRSDQFWFEAFSLVSEDCLEYVSWLKPVLNNVIVAGKSVEVLTSLGLCVKSNHSDKSLYTMFIDRISDNVKEIIQTETENAKQPVAACDSLLYLSFEQMFQENCTTIDKSQAAIQLNDQAPLPIVIERSFNSLVEEKCQNASRKLLDVFMKEFSLKSVLQKFHRFHLMGWGDVMYDFTMSVFRKISIGEYWEDLMSLRAALQEAISESKPDEDSTAIAVVLNRSKKSSGGHHLISITDIMELYFKVEWPLNIVITKKSMDAYNMIFAYLVQVKRALYCLENLKFGKISPESNETQSSEAIHKAHRLSLLRCSILRLVSHWHNFIMTSVIQAEKETFLKQLDSAQDLDAIITAHNHFLDRTITLCLLKREKQADKMIQGTLQKIFGLCVVLHTKWNRGIASISMESLKKHEAQYKECSEFLGIILQNLVSRGAVPLSLESLAFCLMS